MSISPRSRSQSEMYPSPPQLDTRNNFDLDSASEFATFEHGTLLFDNARSGIPGSTFGDVRAVAEQQFDPFSNYSFPFSLPQQSEASFTNSMPASNDLLSTRYNSSLDSDHQNLNPQSRVRLYNHPPAGNSLFVGDAGPQHFTNIELNQTMAELPKVSNDPTVADNTPEAHHGAFCMRLVQTMSEQDIDFHTVVTSMLTTGHLDASRLREILSSSRGREARRRRNTRRKEHTCFDCGVEETTQWRRHPQNGNILCNRCGQKAYRAQSRNS
ncbi:hypothetical protein R3P38DRAFT_2810571 [Favolaschia claudopus]|uniref:GATA-type domain-containing protein n=1 Tax=Favolaschia claudopus TaxID=2862362 RepID=A0AAV9ZA53_9AGAR